MTAPDCPDPEGCPVPDPGGWDLRRLRLIRIPAGVTLHTAYRRARGSDLFNDSGMNPGRFSPIVADGSVVPTLYCARTQTVALLESVFHDVHALGTRIISEPLHLSGRGLIALTTPVQLRLVDLTDGGLERVGLARDRLVATPPAHHACTTAWAVALHGRRIGGVAPAGLLWRSRVAELAGDDSPLLGDLLSVAGDALLLFGDRVPSGHETWQAGDPHYEDLTVAEGRLLAEQIAEQLDAVIVPA